MSGDSVFTRVPVWRISILKRDGAQQLGLLDMNLGSRMYILRLPSCDKSKGSFGFPAMDGISLTCNLKGLQDSYEDLTYEAVSTSSVPNPLCLT